MRLVVVLAGLVGVVHGLVCAGTGGVLELQYPEGVVVTAQNAGLKLTMAQTRDPPVVTWKGENTGYYHYVMVDPDAPTPEHPTLSDLLHQGAINIREDNFTTGVTLEPYAGPSPPSESPPHRYCQFLYVSNVQISYPVPTTRVGFNMSKFQETILAHGGRMVASTYFMTQYSP